MLTYVLPISGGAFPVQLALLSQINSKPDLMLGASGGNIAAYLGLASDFKLDRIKEITNKLHTDLFIKGSKILALFNGGFKRGKGAAKLFKDIFTTEDVQKIEIITLTCVDEQICPRIFSNRSREKSYFRNPLNEADNILYQVSDIEYLEGDLESLSVITMASASIPGLVEPQEFRGSKLSDGGVCYASPLTPLSNYMKDNIFSLNTPVQLIYFSCYNMSNIEQVSKEMDKYLRHALEMTHFSTLQDRALCASLITNYTQNLEADHKTHVTREHLNSVLRSLRDKSFVMILYPIASPDINIINFKPEDIRDAIDITLANYGYYIWYET